MQNFPAYKITHADLDRVKAVAARVFDRSISPQSRMEIIARSAGFRTYASFLATLKERPVLLWGDQSVEEACAKQFDLDPKGIPYVTGVDLNAIVSAGLAWSERGDIEGAMMRSREDRLRFLKADGGRLSDYLDFLDGVRVKHVAKGRYAYRSSVTFEEARNPESLMGYREALRGDTIIVVSPQNQVELSFDFETDAPVLTRGGPWMACRVHLTEHDRFFEMPDRFFEIDWTDRDAFHEEFGDCRVILFDDQDRAEFIRLSREMSAYLLSTRVSSVKEQALDLDNEKSGDFFSIGYYGTARLDRYEDYLSFPQEKLARFALEWLCEIVQVVHGCEYEYKRITDTVMPARLGRLLLRV